MRITMIFLVAALLPACVRPPAPSPASSGREIIPGVYELAAEPFSMPAEFPLPKNAVRISRDPVAADIVFHTASSIEELFELYRDELTAHGLSEYAAGTMRTPLGFRLIFLGWPKQQAIVIQATDAHRLNSKTGLARVVHARLAEVAVRDSSTEATQTPPEN